MRGVRTVVQGEVLSGSLGSRTPGYDATVRVTGIDPGKLFGEKDVPRAGSCSCLWVGHQVYSFSGLGAEWKARSESL